jgi:hypothetical protein
MRLIARRMMQKIFSPTSDGSCVVQEDPSFERTLLERLSDVNGIDRLSRLQLSNGKAR